MCVYSPLYSTAYMCISNPCLFKSRLNAKFSVYRFKN